MRYSFLLVLLEMVKFLNLNQIKLRNMCLMTTVLIVYKMLRARIVATPALKHILTKKVYFYGLITAFTQCKTQYLIFRSKFF